ncbi:hypothetical protein CONLIGDRAFT_682546 [Coniochaeta ligniaria NRRL 30616]|uniref:Pentatricopeptide repeat domain-containing protein n=1 Tax=Coniochaeta ligniaria NRRL 30616 TaxID=1408157 RepID=A0A1J7JE42_9PEZI|nr:hypothetical protein CONLIGDRAFT_682546 [Coniochaeta ligniaria NRRL 30616]
MGTAAVADSAVKDQRRKELDTKIEDARDKLAILLEQAPAYDPKRTRDDPYVLHNANATPPGIYEALTSICVAPIRLLKGASRRGNRTSYLRPLRRELRLQEESEWWKTPPSRMDEVQEMIVEEEMVGDNAHREPMNVIQFSKLGETINNLVDQLLVETYRRPDGTPRTPDLLESAWNNIRMLRSSGYPNYRHADLDPVAAAEARRDLSVVTRNIFRDWKTLKDGFLRISGRDGRIMNPQHAAIYRKRREYFVGKICHNLLIARFAPGIYNYNTLISGFTRVGEPRFGQAVVDSFLLNSRLKPTRMTVVSLLHHYRQGDIVGFYNILRRITGDDSRGLLLRRKPVADVKGDRLLFRWAQQADAVVDHGFVTQRTKIDEPVLEAILDRLIDFRLVRHATTVLGACIREGCAISSRYVRRVVGLCVAQVDRVAAVELLRIFLRDVEKIGPMITASTSGRHKGLPRRLLQLVQICDSNAALRLIVHARETQPTTLRNLDWSFRVNYLRTALWTAFAEQWVHNISSCASLLRAALASGRLDEDRLAEISAMMERTMQQRQETEVENQKYQALARIDWITTLCEVNGSKILGFEHDMVRILFGGRPENAQYDYHMDRRLPLEDRLRRLSSREVGEIRNARSIVETYLSMAKELEKKTEHVLYDALTSRERRHLWKRWWRRDQVFAVGPLVEHWSRYLHVLSRQWKELGSGPLTSSSGYVGTAEKPLSHGDDEFQGAFFESRGPLDRVKIPVPAA